MKKEKKNSIYDGIKMSVKSADVLIIIELLAFVTVTAIAVLAK